jgi:hypothetical protein
MRERRRRRIIGTLRVAHTPQGLESKFAISAWHTFAVKRPTAHGLAYFAFCLSSAAEIDFVTDSVSSATPGAFQ